MAAASINLQTTDDPRDAIHRTVQALAEGKLVAVPSETVYGIACSALNERAVARLAELKQRSSEHPFTLAIKSSDDAQDYVPTLSPLAQRLARRCWPGPVTLVLDSTHADSLLGQLPASVREAVIPNGSVGLRVPAHDALLSILRLTAGPLVLTSANHGKQSDAVNAADVAKLFGDEIDLILDDGPSKFGQPSSVVRVGDSKLHLLRSGVITDQVLKRLASHLIVFVCTGNTCRSPMAEGLMRQRIAERLNCSINELEDHNVMVMSAGIAAMSGGRASAESVQLMKERGIDIEKHESQPLSERLVRFADLILTMTRGHREAIIAQWPDAAARTKVVCRDQSDVSDPIGGPIERYRRCAEQIDSQLANWIDEIDFASIPSIVRCDESKTEANNSGK
ncbi:MAG: threonylcarbamoyl-AMP synthase [Planctomycetaceae bacterium]|nr:threonylcarbamoyl-AMP synthase [Planctomycetales bacterium]MCB9927664.1 threonylcarbamoyl-AMP synthase [Planctomycetaceae bacterium]